MRADLSEAVRRTVKRSPTTHAVAKLVRMAPEVSLREWLDVGRTADVVRVLPNTMVGAARLINAYECVRSVEREGIQGSVAECGVWSGGSIALMALASRRHRTVPRTFHLFDSFEGLPQPSQHDLETVTAFRSAHPDVGFDTGGSPNTLVPIDACRGATVEEVRALFRRLGFDDDSYVVHQGWFQETVPAAAPLLGPLAVLRLDGDWYESTKVCLEHLYDQVVEGGFVIVDDYGVMSGCRRATDEFLASVEVAPRLVDIDGVGVFFRKPSS